MTDKMTSLVQQIKLNAATFHGETVDPTYINFFFGKNGAGKSTLADAFRHPECLEWQTGAKPQAVTVKCVPIVFVPFRTLKFSFDLDCKF
jgi:predicted ATPase